MEFGIFDHNDSGELPFSEHYDNRLRLIEAYDRAGFYCYHLAEHHFTPLATTPSPGIFLSAISQRTERIHFGPLVYLLPFYHPLRLIEEICTLDQLSHGRFEFGVGHGVSPPEAMYWGMDPTSLRRRFEETLAVLIAGFTQPAINFKGEFFDFNDVPVEIQPFQRPYPTIWYGVTTDDSAARAAARGFDVLTNRSIGEVPNLPHAYREHFVNTPDRPGRVPKVGTSRFVVVADTDEAALAIARRAYPKLNHSLETLFRKHHIPVAGGAKAATFDAMRVEGTGIAGSPDTVLAELSAQLKDSGFNYLVLRFAIADMSYAESLRSLNLFVKHVMPELRGLDKPDE